MRTIRDTTLALLVAGAGVSGWWVTGCAGVDCSAAGTCEDAPTDGGVVDATTDGASHDGTAPGDSGPPPGGRSR